VFRIRVPESELRAISGSVSPGWVWDRALSSGGAKNPTKFRPIIRNFHFKNPDVESHRQQGFANGTVSVFWGDLGPPSYRICVATDFAHRRARNRRPDCGDEWRRLRINSRWSRPIEQMDAAPLRRSRFSRSELSIRQRRIFQHQLHFGQGQGPVHQLTEHTPLFRGKRDYDAVASPPEVKRGRVLAGVAEELPAHPPCSPGSGAFSIAANSRITG